MSFIFTVAAALINIADMYFLPQKLTFPNYYFDNSTVIITINIVYSLLHVKGLVTGKRRQFVMIDYT